MAFLVIEVPTNEQTSCLMQGGHPYAYQGADDRLFVCVWLVYLTLLAEYYPLSNLFSQADCEGLQGLAPELQTQVLRQLAAKETHI